MNAPIHFKRIGIFGVGLMGGSLGLALRERSPQSTLIGIGRNIERLQEAVSCGAIHSFTTDPWSISPPLDLLVICTPVRKVAEHLRQSLPSIASDSIVTDVGSTKSTVVRQCEEIMLRKQQFVGSHPMAGSHKTGIEAASPDLYVGRVCVVTQTENSSAESVQKVSDFWQLMGMRVVRMTPEQHDELTAFSSHLPHVVAAALCHAAMHKDKLVEDVIGNGFRDTTRIAAGDATLWLDISLENRDCLLRAIEDIQSLLNSFKISLQHSDEKAVFEFFQRAQNWKDVIDSKK